MQTSSHSTIKPQAIHEEGNNRNGRRYMYIAEAGVGEVEGRRAGQYDERGGCKPHNSI